MAVSTAQGERTWNPLFSGVLGTSSPKNSLFSAAQRLKPRKNAAKRSALALGDAPLEGADA
jgi:hypothetical protein